MWKDTAELGRPEMKIWHMCIALWIPKATNTHSLTYNIYCLSMATTVA